MKKHSIRDLEEMGVEIIISQHAVDRFFVRHPNKNVKNKSAFEEVRKALMEAEFTGKYARTTKMPLYHLKGEGVFVVGPQKEGKGIVIKTFMTESYLSNGIEIPSM